MRASASSVYNTKTWAELAVLRDHEQPVTRARFGTDAATLVSTSMDRTLRLWAPSGSPGAAPTSSSSTDTHAEAPTSPPAKADE